ncbi:MAG: TonB-dependent receptor plug [Flavipsychrobacter sp.]|nr:TonB-dependent receptor plug [Flavipsychrobacter sp.]
MRKSITLTAAFLLLFCCAALAQNSNGTIKGFVYDKKTGEPVIYTNVQVLNAKTGVQTDVNGYFSISLPSGSYTLLTTGVGYDSSIITINLLPDAMVTKKILLQATDVQLKGVEISARKTERITRINTGVTTVTPRELKMLPSAGGEPDIAQYLQVIPGVVFTGDQGGQLYIRGGSPAQTGIYLDGITIYSPFHSIGLFSVFETDAIRNVDVYTAGFSAQYGNRTSAVVDVHTKDGNKNNLAGIVSVSPIMSRLVLEGPIVRPKVDNGSSITYLVTGKTSYLDQTSKSIYSGFGDAFKNGLPYRFTDVYGKLTFSGDNGSKLNVFGFNFDDNANLLDDSTHASIADYHWKATGVGANVILSPAGSSSLIEGKFAYSNYDISLNQLNSPIDTAPRTSSISGFEAAINFTYFLPNYSQLKYGIEVSGFHTALSYYLTPGLATTEDRQSTLAGLYFLYRQNFSSKVIFEPSIRFQYYSELQKISPEPRVGLKYNLSNSVRLKAAAGIYSQNIISTKSDQDIVNLFSGFLLSPDQQIKNPDGQAVKSNLQTAYHAVAGVEVDVQNVEFNVEPWIKYFGQVDELNRNKTVSSDPDFVAATGLAKGLDLSGKYNHERVYLWGAVGYQSVNYTSIDSKGKKQTYPTPFDTRFNINAVASYTAGKKKDWELSARFNLRAPFPFTQTQGFYENVNLGTLQSPVTTQNGGLNVIYADKINGGRLSYYHRLDISVRKRFSLKNKTSLDATAAVTNAYNRENIFYVNRITNVKVYQLPLFPSINITWNF